MRRKSALAGLAVAACFAVGTTVACAERSKDRYTLICPLRSLALFARRVARTVWRCVAVVSVERNERAASRGRNPLHDLVMTAAIAPGFDLNVGSDVDMTGRFNGFGQRSANDGLFLASSATPYATVSGGDFVGATMALASDLHFSVGHASLTTQAFGVSTCRCFRSDAATVCAMRWRCIAPMRHSRASIGISRHGAGLNVTASNSGREEQPVGKRGRSRAEQVNNNAVAASAHASLGDGWVTTVSFNQGVTQLDLKTTGNLLGTTVDTRAYSISVAKHGLFAENDSLGLAVSRPIQLFAGRLGVPWWAASIPAIAVGNDRTPLLARSRKPIWNWVM